MAITTVWWAHYPFDVLAWGSAFLAARWQYRRWPGEAQALARITTPSYHIALALGALAGAWLLGSANSLRSIAAAPSHSVAGALAGGILAVELWKWRHGVKGSTGGVFALPIATGIAVGRIGCFLSGLPDFTYGAETSVPWAVDIGDHVARHPVQLYEAASMALFAIALAGARLRGANWARSHAFHALVIVYAVQRFMWEFCKPYPPLAGPLNVFHLLMLGLMIYGCIWWRASRSVAASPA
jgi:phosphatidylglycerol---prolipoprotein diacylglyceryl transferase